MNSRCGPGLQSLKNLPGAAESAPRMGHSYNQQVGWLLARALSSSAHGEIKQHNSKEPMGQRESLNGNFLKI